MKMTTQPSSSIAVEGMDGGGGGADSHQSFGHGGVGRLRLSPGHVLPAPQDTHCFFASPAIAMQLRPARHGDDASQ